MPGFVGRHFPGFPVAWFLHQHTLTLWDGAGDRLVVDDAIVVVEAVEHHIEQGLSPKAAAFKAMEEVSAPVIGIALVLSAVFVPTAFIPGITGRLYQQFAVTIAVSVIISAFNALSLSPALGAAASPRERIARTARSLLPVVQQNFWPGYPRLRGYVRRADSQMAFSRLLLLGFTFLAGWFGKKVPGRLPVPMKTKATSSVLSNSLTPSSLQRADKAADATRSSERLRRVALTTVVGYNMFSGVQNTYSAFFWITLSLGTNARRPTSNTTPSRPT